MWHTSRGDRTLNGDEAVLVRAAIDAMVDALLIDLDDEFDETAGYWDSGIPLYNAFSPAQRIALLHDVAKHLLTETEHVLPLSAALEATVAAIFVDIRDSVAIEIDFLAPPREDLPLRSPSWRQRVLAAYQAILRLPSGDQPEWDPAAASLPSPTCNDVRVWESLVESLADAILWDRDFEMAESFLDVDPGVSHQRRQLLGIDEDYFIAIAPDPRPDEVQGLISRTREIVRAKPR
jgi:hypothetical protein